MKTATTTEARETLAKIITQCDEAIAKLEYNLNTAILDGTPYLLCCRTEAGTEGEDSVQVFGHYVPAAGQPAVYGWRSMHALPHHMCGAVLKSPDSADRAIAKCVAEPQFPGGFYFRMHRRDFERMRLESTKAFRATMAAHLERLA